MLEENPDVTKVFQITKFLLLDEADKVLDVGFEEELRVVFQYLPNKYMKMEEMNIRSMMIVTF